jgi:hypothetical protein
MSAWLKNEDIKTFDWKILDRKTLDIKVVELEGFQIVSGRDDSGIIYVLHSGYLKEGK